MTARWLPCIFAAAGSRSAIVFEAVPFGASVAGGGAVALSMS